MLALLFSHWKLALGAAALLLLAAGAWKLDHAAYERGAASITARQVQADREKTHAASEADDAALRCALDAACRLRDDGYKRD